MSDHPEPIPPCPSCGGRVFIKTLRTKGTATRLLTVQEDGHVTEEGLDGHTDLAYEPARIRCEGCGKTASNPRKQFYFDYR